MTDPGVMQRLVRPLLPGAARYRRCWPDQELDHPRLVGCVPSQSCPGSGPDRPVHLDVRAGSQRMAMLADLVELVIGVDTHKDTHTAAVVQAVSGAMLEQVTVPATPAGYRKLLALADRQRGRRVWAIEGTGGYGAGLTRFLGAHAA